MEFEAEGAQPMDVVGEVRVVGEQPIGLGIHAANGAHPLTEAEIPMNTATDWPSAQRSLQAIKIECNNTPDGTSRWREWIQQEAIEITKNQIPPRGDYPQGSFQSSLTVEPSFLDEDAARTREQSISQDHMPFLFNILLATLQATDLVSEHPADETLEPEEEDYGHTLNPDEEKGLHFEEFFLEGISAVNIRKRKIASTICSMIAFGRNPSSNGLQLFNSIRFMAGGVSERINAYLHLIGLTSSRQTAIRALERMSVQASRNFRNSMAVTEGWPLRPSICIGNLDNGSWGYIVQPNRSLLQSLDQSQLSLASYYQALRQVPKLKIQPYMFLPQRAEEEHFVEVIKSQIAQVMAKYIAEPSDQQSSISVNPPPIDPIDCTRPQIQMLNLIDASDNSPEGIAELLEFVIRQTGISSEEFSSFRTCHDAR